MRITIEVDSGGQPDVKVSHQPTGQMGQESYASSSSTAARSATSGDAIDAGPPKIGGSDQGQQSGSAQSQAAPAAFDRSGADNAGAAPGAGAAIES